VPVQHHHAHVAACLVEHGRTGPALGVAFDGSGYGADGSLWGGELLLVTLERCDRLGHLRPIALAGGDAAVREPWRLALAALLDAGEPLDLLAGIEASRRAQVVALLERRLFTTPACGAGRWFDAVAALCRITSVSSYDGQAACELEAKAAPGPAAPYDLDLSEAGGMLELDLRPAIRGVSADLRRHGDIGRVASRFYETMAHAALVLCRAARTRGAPGQVVLAGGCFGSPRLLARTRALLAAEGLDVLTHRRVPPNDGGIALGQAAVASAILGPDGTGLADVWPARAR
jgi:hydrogenase maturation protein HypF